jgi:hypothetical protein
MVVNTAIGMFTPPFGLNLFVAGAVDEEWTMTKLMRPILPFIWVSLIPLLVVTYVPQISLWLPKLIYGSGHPYAQPLTGSGTEASIAALSRDDLAGFHATWFWPITPRWWPRAT